VDIWVNALRAWIMIFAFILLIVSIVAYQRTKNKRVLIVSVAFVIFFVKGIILTIGLLDPSIEDLYSSGLGDLLDVLILVLLATTILKK
jgi:uncharacterized membrane protein